MYQVLKRITRDDCTQTQSGVEICRSRKNELFELMDRNVWPKSAERARVGKLGS